MGINGTRRRSSFDCSCCWRALLGFDSRFLCDVSFLFFPKSTTHRRNHMKCFCASFLLLVVVQIVQIKSYALTSKRNEAHIYVGTVIGAITIKSNLPRWGEALPPPPVQSFLLSDEPIGAAPGRDYYLICVVATRMVRTTINLVGTLHVVRYDTS
jgi:hypothetical protein